MNIEKRIKESETKQFKAIFPNTLNANETLFGGTAMKWMDEVAYITATRFTRKKMVTVSVNNMKFLLPVMPGTIAEITGKGVEVTSLKIIINVEIYIEEMYNETRKKAIEACFTFVAINKHFNPIRIDEEKK